MRHDQTTRPMSKSPVALARVALHIGQAALPRYSSKYSPRRYTQAQLFACLVLRQFFKTDYCGVIALLHDFRELREVLGLADMPHYSTLCYTQRRLMRAGRFHALQQQVWQAAQRAGLIEPKPTGIVDAIGLEARHISRYYGWCTGFWRFRQRRWPKLTLAGTEVVWVDLDEPLDTIRRVILSSSHSYVPAGHGSLENVSGILRGRELLARLLEHQPLDWTALLSPPMFVPESRTLLDVLQQLKQTGQPLALIIDEYGGLQGIITQTDVLEALIGDIQLPGQQKEPEAVQREDGSWLFDGRLPVSELKDLLNLRELPREEEAGYDTLGGFVMTVLGQIPSIGQHFEHAGRRFEVADMDGRRVDRVLVSVISSPAASPSATLDGGRHSPPRSAVGASWIANGEAPR